MRLIKADSAKTVICELVKTARLQHNLIYAIERCTTIDAAPVVHGRWMRSAGKSHIWYCSACGDKINYKQNRRTYNIPKVPVEQKNKFCRNCGAKMDGGAD